MRRGVSWYSAAVVLLCGVIAYQYGRICQLQRVAEVRVKEVLYDLQNINMYPMISSCSANFAPPDTLPEPEETKTEDVFARIEMLRQHLDAVPRPSPAWIDDVLRNVQQEIAMIKAESLHASLRQKQIDAAAPGGNFAPGPCTFLSSPAPTVPVKVKK